jgi:hypothetical protein
VPCLAQGTSALHQVYLFLVRPCSLFQCSCCYHPPKNSKKTPQTQCPAWHTGHVCPTSGILVAGTSMFTIPMFNVLHRARRPYIRYICCSDIFLSQYAPQIGEFMIYLLVFGHQMGIWAHERVHLDAATILGCSIHDLIEPQIPIDPSDRSHHLGMYLGKLHAPFYPPARQWDSTAAHGVPAKCAPNTGTQGSAIGRVARVIRTSNAALSHPRWPSWQSV